MVSQSPILFQDITQSSQILWFRYLRFHLSILHQNTHNMQESDQVSHKTINFYNSIKQFNNSESIKWYQHKIKKLTNILYKSKIKTIKIIKSTKHKSKFREEKRKEMLNQRTHLNRRANPEWNPCKSSLQLYLSLSNLI